MPAVTMMVEPTIAVRFPAVAATAAVVQFSLRFPHPGGGLYFSRTRFGSLNDGFQRRRNIQVKNRVRASAENSEPVGRSEKLRYHPSEAIAASALQESGDATLTPAEITRTAIEVNSKATLMFSNLIDGEVQENIFLPELPYVTDEHGNIYFKVNNEEDMMQSLASDNNFLQVLIGLDTTKMLSEMELSGPAEIDFGIEEIGDDDSEDDEENSEEDEEEDEDHEKDWVTILETEEDEDSDEDIGDWANLETMKSSHPMYFAKKLAEVAAGDPVDWMEQPPAGLVIQGLLRPVSVDEHSGIHKHMVGPLSRAGTNQANVKENVQDITVNNGQRHRPKDSLVPKKSLKSKGLRSGTSFYKLEMINIQLVSAHGHVAVVEMEEFRKACPDAIAHSAPKIISRLKAGGDKTLEALKSLCWRCKGIQVEEATVIGVDALGFDLRVCSGAQVQTLRFTFSVRATSEYSAERQLNDLLFPRFHHKVADGEMNSPKEMLA